ncbi:MAG: 4-hydroxy-tetrahydrodipicolinate synthase [Rhizobium sp.]|nr:4-hydroxy-tetrahydrodipicolinate synthase [Rhizobium sp.]
MQSPLQRTLPAGAFCDLVTPFRNGAIDTEALANLVKWQIRSGISGIVVCGEAGEATSLTRDERAAVIRCAIETAGDQLPVIAGTGTNATASTIDLTTDAAQLGAAAAVIVTPYYNKPSQEGIFRHYEQIAAAVNIPIVICNAPARTASDLAPRTLERLATIAGIVGLQDCTGDLGRLALIPPGLKNRFRQYSGHDLTAFSFNLAGGAGSFSVAANIAPRFVSAMHDALRTGNLDAAITLNARVNPILQVLEREPGPATVKQALAILRDLDPELRLPLTPIAPETAAALRTALVSLSNADQR